LLINSQLTSGVVVLLYNSWLSR